MFLVDVIAVKTTDCCYGHMKVIHTNKKISHNSNPLFLVDVIAVMGDVFICVYNFHVPLALKVGCPSSGFGCDIALVSIFLCVGLMATFCAVTFFSGFLSTDVYFVVSHSWCGVSRLLLEFLRVQVLLCVLS
jgi:hypothetical protein